MEGDGTLERTNDKNDGAEAEGAGKNVSKTLPVLYLMQTLFSAELDNIQKVKEMSKQQEKLANKIEGENIKAQHMEYVNVLAFTEQI